MKSIWKELFKLFKVVASPLLPQKTLEEVKLSDFFKGNKKGACKFTVKKLTVNNKNAKENLGGM